MWKATVTGIGLAILLVLLAAFMRVVFLVGILYGLGLFCATIVFTKCASKVENEEPTNYLGGVDLVSFPFKYFNQYPQLLLLVVTAVLTIISAPMASSFAGYMTFSSTTENNHVEENGFRPEMRFTDLPARNNPDDVQFMWGTLEVVAVNTSSIWDKNDGKSAFDSNLNTCWNAGKGAPAWLEADMGKSVTLSEIRLLLNTSGGPQTVELWVSDDPMGETRQQGNLVHTFNGVYRKYDELHFGFPLGMKARYIQIRTTRSFSWVSWFEIAIDGH
ncbi:MAG: discoidin domain-containing protein [Zavarzinella sp.]